MNSEDLSHLKKLNLATALVWFVYICSLWGMFHLFPLHIAAAYSVLLTILAVGSIIDIGSFTLPLSLTLCSVAVGLVANACIPEMLAANSRLGALGFSALGLLAGYGIIWFIVEIGRLVYGRKKLVFPADVAFTWTRTGDEAELRVGDETHRWMDLFSRESDQLAFTGCKELTYTGHASLDLNGIDSMVFRYSRLKSPANVDLMEIDTVRGKCSQIDMPREVMGMGDAFLMAGIGAFIGWEGVVFTLFAASWVGFVGGLIGRLATGSNKLPFGPYLALGAALWLLGGNRLAQHLIYGF